MRLPAINATFLIPIGLAGLVLPGVLRAQSALESPPVTLKPVVLKDEASAWMLSNGIVAARTDRNSGDLVSVRFKECDDAGDTGRTDDRRSHLRSFKA